MAQSQFPNFKVFSRVNFGQCILNSLPLPVAGCVVEGRGEVWPRPPRCRGQIQGPGAPLETPTRSWCRVGEGVASRRERVADHALSGR